MSLSHLSILSLLHFISSLLFLFYILPLSPYPSLFFPFPHLSLLSSLILSLSQSNPPVKSPFTLFYLLFSPFSHYLLPSLSSPLLSFLSTFSVSNSICSLPPVSPLHFTPLSLLSLLFSPFPSSLPFSSLFSPLFLSLSTPFCLSHLHFLSSLLSLHLSLLSFLPPLTSPFLFSIPSPLYSLSTQSFYLHPLLCLIFILFLLPFSPI